MMVAALTLGACQPEGLLVVPNAPEEERDDLEAGDVVRYENLELAVPEAGTGVGLIVETEDGWVELTLTHDDAGITAVRAAVGPDDAPLGGADGTSAVTSELAAGACSDQAYTLIGLSHKWTKALSWSFFTGNLPGALDVARVETLLRRAASNITGARNDCGRADQVSAQHTYLGRRTSPGPGISVSNGVITCSGRNGLNVVGFGAMSGLKAATCWYWSSSGVMVEADIKFGSAVNWLTADSIPSSCTNALHFESVATHEFGHAFGLNHPGSTHTSLTMQPGNACDLSKRTLGLGDMLGLERLY